MAEETLDQINQQMFQAAKSGDLEAFQEALEQGAQPVTASDETGYNVLHYAATRGHLEIVNAVLEQDINPNVREPFTQSTALHQASFNGHLDVARALLIKGARPTITTSDGKSPYDFAEEQGHEYIAQLYLEAGYDPETKTVDPGKLAAFIAAAEQGTQPQVTPAEEPGLEGGDEAADQPQPTEPSQEEGETRADEDQKPENQETEEQTQDAAPEETQEVQEEGADTVVTEETPEEPEQAEQDKELQAEPNLTAAEGTKGLEPLEGAIFRAQKTVPVAGADEGIIVEAAEITVEPGTATPLDFHHRNIESYANTDGQPVVRGTELTNADILRDLRDEPDAAAVTAELLQAVDGRDGDAVTMRDVAELEQIFRMNIENEHRNGVQRGMYVKALEALPQVVRELGEGLEAKKTETANALQGAETALQEAEAAVVAAADAVTNAGDTVTEEQTQALEAAHTAADEAQKAMEKVKPQAEQAEKAVKIFDEQLSEYLSDENVADLKSYTGGYMDLLITQEGIKPTSVKPLPGIGYSETALEVQALLKLAGHDPGRVDGLAGGSTRAAIDSYRSAEGLEGADLHGLHDHLLQRMGEDQDFLNTLRQSAIGAVEAGQSGHDVRAAQIFLNLRGFSGQDGQKLKVDGHPERADGETSNTEHATMILKDKIATEEAELTSEAAEESEANRIIVEHAAAQAKVEELTNRFQEAQGQVEDLTAPDRQALEIGRFIAGMEGREDDNKFGTSRIAKAFNTVVPGVLDEGTAHKKGLNLRKQFADKGAFHEPGSDYQPRLGDVVFYGGLKGRKTGVVDRIDEQGRAVFTDADGGQLVLLSHEGRIKAFEDQGERLVESGTHNLKGFGDTAELIRDSQLAPEQPLAADKVVPEQPLGSPGQ